MLFLECCTCLTNMVGRTPLRRGLNSPPPHTPHLAVLDATELPSATQSSTSDTRVRLSRSPPSCVQAGEGQTAGGQLTKRPGGSGARPASGGTLARKGPARRTTSGGSRPAGGGGGAGILRFYTDDAPGLKMCAPP